MTSLAQLRAMSALDAVGIPRPPRLEPASSVTNEVWLGGDLVIRINRQLGSRLRREAFLASYLPPEIGYPPVLAYGGRAGADFLVLRRVPGEVLSRCWPDMDLAARRAAIRELAGMLVALHRTPTPAGLPPVDSPQPLEVDSASPVQPVLDALVQARGLPHVPTQLVDDLTAMTRAFAPAVRPFDGSTLIHGDLTFENVLWDGQRISALLDFEWARGAPSDVDLDVLLRMCACPFLHVAADYAHRAHPLDYADIPIWLAEDYPELFSSPHIRERLALYSIAFDVRDLLSAPPPDEARHLPRFHALNRLRATAAGRDHLDWLDQRPR